MPDFIFDRRFGLIISGGLLTLIISAFVLYVMNEAETIKYISDHECEIIDQKLRSEYNYVFQPDGEGIWLPVTKIDNLYECKIEGDRGSRFWNKG